MLAGVQPFTAHIADAVDHYCQAHSNPLPDEFLQHLQWTAEKYEFPERMDSSLQAQLFIFMASDHRARRVLDVGFFSGFSVLAWREGMKGVMGEVWTLENDPLIIKAYKTASKKYDPTERIHLEAGPAIDTLKYSLKRIERTFGIIYLDTHKVICRGLVADSTEKNENATDQWRVPNLLRAERVHKFNEHAMKEPRVDVLLLPAFDGLSLIKLRP